MLHTALLTKQLEFQQMCSSRSSLWRHLLGLLPMVRGLSRGAGNCVYNIWSPDLKSAPKRSRVLPPFGRQESYISRFGTPTAPATAQRRARPLCCAQRHLHALRGAHSRSATLRGARDRSAVPTAAQKRSNAQRRSEIPTAALQRSEERAYGCSVVQPASQPAEMGRQTAHPSALQPSQRRRVGKLPIRHPRFPGSSRGLPPRGSLPGAPGFPGGAREARPSAAARSNAQPRRGWASSCRSGAWTCTNVIIVEHPCLTIRGHGSPPNTAFVAPVFPSILSLLSYFYRFLPIFRTFLGDFNPQSRRLRTLWEWKNRVLLEEYYMFNVVIPLEVE